MLQDVHWSAGLVGYFPTYTLGTLYSAQFLDAIERELGPIDAIVRAGEYDRLLGWMREHVHSRGALVAARADRDRRDRRGPGHAALMRYLRAKYGALYDLAMLRLRRARQRLRLDLHRAAQPLEPLEVRERLGQREALLVEAEPAAPHELGDVVGAAGALAQRRLVLVEPDGVVHGDLLGARCGPLDHAAVAGIDDRRRELLDARRASRR